MLTSTNSSRKHVKMFERCNSRDAFEKSLQDFKLQTDIIEKLFTYSSLILEWNKKFNLTGKKTLLEVGKHLIADSLRITDHINLEKMKSVCDVGSGSGIPGIPIKILYPHLNLHVIEVNRKKQEFIRFVCDKLELENVFIHGVDWRTFNRKKDFDIDFFVTKAAFADLEIIRMFRSNCFYQDKFIVYWTTDNWIVDKYASDFLVKSIDYKNFNKNLKFAFFSKPENFEQIKNVIK